MWDVASPLPGNRTTMSHLMVKTVNFCSCLMLQFLWPINFVLLWPRYGARVTNGAVTSTGSCTYEFWVQFFWRPSTESGLACIRYVRGSNADHGLSRNSGMHLKFLWSRTCLSNLTSSLLTTILSFHLTFSGPFCFIHFYRCSIANCGTSWRWRQ